jgi:5,10-methylenetetrahydromethanopterin reductase
VTVPDSRPERPVEIGLGIQSDKRHQDYARLAALAEESGFDVLSVFADLWFQPPIYPLLEMARVTSRIRLGAACWNPYTMHPYEIAGQAAALQQASGGRAYVGLARGAWMDELAITQTRPLTRLREAVQLVRALLSGDVSGIDADIYPLAAGARMRYELPDRLPPVLIGTWGAKAAALAGQVADELKVGGSANPRMVDVMRQRVAPGASAAGRSQDAVGVVVGAVTVVDEDGSAARARARTEVAMYLAVVAELDPTCDVPEALLNEVKAHLAQGDHSAAGACIPDDVLDLFAFSGTPDHVAEQAQRLIDAGARRVEFGTPHGLTDAGGIDLLGRRVLPQLELR